MKGKLFLLAGVTVMSFSSCKKEKLETPTPTYEGKQKSALSTFAVNIAEQSYNDLNNAATELQAAMDALRSTGSHNAFVEAQIKWKAIREIWEQTETYMDFGPAKDGKYAAMLDTWPTRARSLDSLLEESSYSTELAEVQKLPAQYRGFHALEWILFGKDGKKAEWAITGRQSEYMVSVARDIKNQCEALFQEWASASLNYTQKVATAGESENKTFSKQTIFSYMVESMNALCSTISTSKIESPLIQLDSTLLESPYSKSSLVDIKNNLIGLRNVYKGKYRAYQGTGLSDLISEKDKTLDTRILDRIDSTLSAADKVTMTMDRALFYQRADLFKLKERVDSLKSVLANDLRVFATDNLK